jgi:hypothetical protein
MNVERIYGSEVDEGGEMELLAILVRAGASHGNADAGFVSEPEHLLQVGFLSYPEGHVIRDHVHLPKQRPPSFASPTQEVLIVTKGRFAADLYDSKKRYVERIVLTVGDVLILLSGGHGFEAFEDTELIEVKDGPYAGPEDKEFI